MIAERNTVIVADILDGAARLVPGSVQAIITSPPYWGLRDYGVPPTAWPAVEYRPMPGLPPVVVPAETVCLGAEQDPLAFVGHLVHVFRCLRPALREDGTLWLNLGDSYARNGGTDRAPSATAIVGSTRNTLAQQPNRDQCAPPGLTEKNLIGVPWRAAFALQADGWVLRSEIIWHKVAPMPESVTDRPTKAHEQVFLFSKRATYFYDAESIREPGQEWSGQAGTFARSNGKATSLTMPGQHYASHRADRADRVPSGRNKRTVWSPPPAQFPGAHFATFPPELVRPMIRAGSSDYGCCERCGAPWRRVVEREAGDTEAHTRPKQTAGMASRTSTLSLSGNGSREWAERGARVQTTGWEPGCACNAPVVPCTILDPFMGSGTTAEVCAEEGRHWLGIDADPRAVAWTEERTRAVPVGRLAGM